MKKILLVVLTFTILVTGYSQVTEIECIVFRKAGAYLAIEPAQYDESILPKTGEKVMLSIYLKDNLPPGKEEGFYELFPAEMIKLIPEIKSILVKTDGDIEAVRLKYGIENIQLGPKKRVLILWESSN